MVIMFVCSGNTCRSPMAEGYLRKKFALEGKKAEVISAGTNAAKGEKATEGAVKAMESMFGIDISGHRSMPVYETDIKRAFVILTMSKTHKLILISFFPEYKDKIFTLSEYADNSRKDISDPFGGDDTIYRNTAAQIAEYIDIILEKQSL